MGRRRVASGGAGSRLLPAWAAAFRGRVAVLSEARRAEVDQVPLGSAPGLTPAPGDMANRRRGFGATVVASKDDHAAASSVRW